MNDSRTRYSTLCLFLVGLCLAHCAFAQGTWTSLAPLNTGLQGPSAGVINGKLYVASGCCAAFTPPFPRFHVLQVYDPVADSWTTKNPIPLAVYFAPSGMITIQGKLYVAGGMADQAHGNNVATVQEYDAAGDSWGTVTSLPSAGSAQFGGVINGKLYVSSGQNPSNTAQVSMNVVFDPATNMWSPLAPIRTPRAGGGSGVLNGKLYTVGGTTNGGHVLATVEAYDPTTDMWSDLAPMHTARFAAGVGVVNGKLFAVGGNDGHQVLDVVEAYDPATNMWTTMPKLLVATQLPGVGVINGVLYVAGGFDVHQQPLKTLQAFTAGCDTGVTRESQGDQPWGDDLYDHSSTLTVHNRGCAMTSLSMALNTAGSVNDPDTLNDFMTMTDTDYSGLAVNWGPATRDFSGGTLKFHATRIDSTVDLPGATKYLDDVLCQQHHPVIVGVHLNDQGTPGHFIVVTGKQGSDYTIADPGFSGRTTLSDYDNEFETRGFVADPAGDRSELDLAIGDVAEALVVDPSARETGFDAALGQVVEQIPTSAYFRDSLQDDVTGAPATETTHLTEIFQPAPGVYQIVITGLKLGTYSLSTRIFSQDATSQPELLITGIAGPGSTTTYTVQLASTPGSTSSIAVAATFASTLADISNSLQLNLIDNHGIANSLSQKISAAENANAADRANIVNAFTNEVIAQRGKHISGEAVQVLLADANSLANQ